MTKRKDYQNENDDYAEIQARRKAEIKAHARLSDEEANRIGSDTALEDDWDLIANPVGEEQPVEIFDKAERVFDPQAVTAAQEGENESETIYPNPNPDTEPVEGDVTSQPNAEQATQSTEEEVVPKKETAAQKKKREAAEADKD